MKTRPVRLIALIPLALSAALLGAGSVNATEQSQQRQDARDVRQDTRQDAQDAKQDCRADDQKSNADCRQDKRDTKQAGRDQARDIKY